MIMNFITTSVGYKALKGFILRRSLLHLCMLCHENLSTVGDNYLLMRSHNPAYRIMSSQRNSSLLAILALNISPNFFSWYIHLKYLSIMEETEDSSAVIVINDIPLPVFNFS